MHDHLIRAVGQTQLQVVAHAHDGDIRRRDAHPEAQGVRVAVVVIERLDHRVEAIAQIEQIGVGIVLTVVAAPAVQRVITRTTGQRVIAVTAFQYVVTAQAIEGVAIAIQADQRIDTVGPVDDQTPSTQL